MIDTGLEYRPGDPVQVRVVHREHRIDVTDDGGAVDRAGRPSSWHAAAERVLREFDVNITAAGVVSLPVVPAGPPSRRSCSGSEKHRWRFIKSCSSSARERRVRGGRSPVDCGPCQPAS